MTLNDHTSHVRVVPLVSLKRFDWMLRVIIALQVVNIGISTWRMLR